MFELIEDHTASGRGRYRTATFTTETEAREFIAAMVKVGALWITMPWGWRNVPMSGPVKEIRRVG